MKKIIAALVLFVCDGLFMFLFKSFPDTFFPYYRDLSKRWIAFLSVLTSPLKVAVWDIGFVILVVIAVISAIRVIIRKRSFLNYLSSLVLTVSVLCFIAVNGWMLNHYAPRIGKELSLEVKQYSYEELYETTGYYLTKAEESALHVQRDEEGHLLKSDFDELSAIAGASYEKLAGKYGLFKGSNVRVKRLSVAGEYLMYNGIVGMFMPITGEAGVPASVPEAPLCFTMAHEAAHRLGLAKEEEANFAAFLACAESEDPRFVYSAYYNAFSYCFSALYKIDAKKAMELYESHEGRAHELLKLDRRDTAETYAKYDSPLQDVSDQINDTYLKTFDEESGIRSYGEVVDYLIAWHLKYDGKE